jgi:hypothetical protein
MNLAQRTEALLAMVQRYREDRCRALLEPAQAQAQALVKTALADSHRRVRTALVEQRKRAGAALASANAALQTERRLQAHRYSVQWLEQAWPQLRAALLARWRDPAIRQRWIRHHIGAAHASLPASTTAWTLLHAPDWTEADTATARAAAQALRVATLQTRADAGIAAGFCVQCGHNAFDATLDGLLAERALLEGRLLQHLQEPP